MIIKVVLVHFGCFNHLRPHVDDPMHDLLVLSIYTLGLSLFADVIQRLGWRSLDLDILLVNITGMAF
jgi:hypothetical protein